MTETPNPPIVPLSNMVLGIQDKAATQTKGGLFLPQTAQKRTSFTKVVAIGPDVEKVAVGTRVAYKDYTQHEITYNGVDYLLIEEVDILAKMEA